MFDFEGVGSWQILQGKKSSLGAPFNSFLIKGINFFLKIENSLNLKEGLSLSFSSIQFFHSLTGVI